MLKTWLVYSCHRSFAKHGTPTDIISDQGKHFISRFWRSLFQLFGHQGHLSTAYHPETDGPNRTGQPGPGAIPSGVHQLPTRQLGQPPSLGRVCIQHTSHSATMVTPFFANKGFNPKLEVSLEPVCVGYCSSGCDRSQRAPSVSSRPDISCPKPI